MRGSFAGLMRAQMGQERQRRLARIKTLKAMIKGITAAIAKADSRAALRNLAAIKKHLAEDLRSEVTKLAESASSGKRMIVKFRRDAWGS
jgi:hypothetical protein